MRLALLSFAVGATLAAALAPLTAKPATGTVVIDNFVFSPSRLTVKAGTTITWTNRDDIPHTVASSERLFKSKAMDTDESYTFTFMTPGEYSYFCSLHPHMTGTIVVEPASGGGATP